MSTVRVLPHPHLCPDGVTFASKPGQSLCDALLAHGVPLEHACEKVAACATCHVYIRQGGASVPPSNDLEEDQLDSAWALQADSRLACCVKLGDGDLLIEIPKHSRNHAREHG
ncbi:2Fe-2S iron-sulfur cluster-binding protein [Zoogloea sp.]|uniref:2Fe-2S iron-sulfur cluster-binding protein n=1 Tax=Zoogloea sp. TaxID=49181 RepID=UPI0026001425|nr:2Fe-2S iron-sulfur cluster-binding protein [Zoogloea sp.]MCK6393634.1 2Fe-2S iron-sulfur cluster-binding protein [Zoogloea sp.]